MSTAIVWFRRDLCLEDNPALSSASQRHERIVPVYVHSPSTRNPWAAGDTSRWWLHQSLAALSQALAARGSSLRLCQGEAASALRAIANETAACAVYWNRRYEPGEAKSDELLIQSLRKAGIHSETYGSSLLLDPSGVKTEKGCGYRVFSPFWKRFTGILKSDAYCWRPLPAPAPWRHATDTCRNFPTLGGCRV